MSCSYPPRNKQAVTVTDLSVRGIQGVGVFCLFGFFFFFICFVLFVCLFFVVVVVFLVFFFFFFFCFPFRTAVPGSFSEPCLGIQRTRCSLTVQFMSRGVMNATLVAAVGPRPYQNVTTC